MALVYPTRHREDRDAVDVIGGTFTVNVVPYFALIHNGSTHSYVSCVMANKLGIRVEEIVSDVTILSPLGHSTHVNKIYRRCLLQVQGEVFPANLMEFSFGEFDIILGVDWLSEHRVSLDCATKWVTLRTLDGNEIIMIREHQDYLSNVISTLVADNLICKGCVAYLAYIFDMNVDGAVLEKLCVDKQFLDVFPEEFSILPLEYEVEFEIELFPRIALVSIAPYHMAPKQLKELKVQLQEFLDHGFIRPMTHVKLIEEGKTSDFAFNSKRVLCYRGSYCVHSNLELMQSILREAHNSPYTMRPERSKMYQDLLRTDYSLPSLAKLYIFKTVRLDRVPISIIINCDPRFMSRFWKKLHAALGMRLNFSTTFHPYWEEHLSLDEFAYNIASIRAFGWLLIKLFTDARDCLRATSDRQKSCFDLKRMDMKFSVGDRAFLKVSPWKKVLRFCRKGKLSPRFIGPYCIVKRVGPVEIEVHQDLSFERNRYRSLITRSKFCRGSKFHS
ncbi:DNA/RNA polymerases superfamily protein [Gossypium australe]|uniref:DNA/RNA polymerases superfamily protein n=1 Tax=Gossypium australe TaxID=47621 RepID=A0A5B6WR83_9ROSI|nr:DNA/RNA polymerases superfamily protein [Gossypium australe]